MLRDPIANRIAGFLLQIGLRVKTAELTEPTFLPGIAIREGAIVVDEDRLLYPGDLLHEAGHLAVLSPEERAVSNGNFGLNDDGGWEMAAIAWSYAAAVHIQLDLNILFHPHGYRGGSKAFIEGFPRGQGVGEPMLDWLGLTTVSKDKTREYVYPAMRHWLRR